MDGSDDNDPSVVDDLGWVVTKMPDFVSRQTPAGVYLYASPACRDLLGYEPAELEGTSSYDYVHPADFGVVAATSEAQLTGSADIRTVRHRMRRKDGSFVWCVNSWETVCAPMTQAK